jgi:2-polyprenyl-3-methyl-5-hydroxy-6-metoxy-1,4-benzoquinol methylase
VVQQPSAGNESTESLTRLRQVDIHEQWESDYLNPEMDRFYTLAFDWILETLGDTSGETILDVGCGYCYHTKRLARGHLAITAIDFSEAALARASTTLAQAGIANQVTLQQADATDLPFEDKSFDHVLMWGVLMHIPQAEKALAELSRILKPGGKLVLSETNAHSLEVRFLEPLIERMRRLLGRKPRPRKRTQLGIEEWQAAEHGGLLVRKTDVGALIARCERTGLSLKGRIAGEFTQIYTRLPGKILKRAVYAFNRAYFRRGFPGPALGNILVFEKQSGMQTSSR